jgi:hypothetical protein
MSTSPPNRPSPRLVLYGFVFRFLCRVALHASERALFRAHRQPNTRRRLLRKDRSPLPLNLDPGQ